MSTISKQDTFNAVWNGLKSQGFVQSVRRGCDPNRPDHILCAYRGESGRKCAAGWLLPDGLYDPAMENGAVMSQFGDYMLENTKLVSGVFRKLGYDLDFVGLCQSVHDDNPQPDDMERGLRHLASRHGLTVPSGA